MDDCILDQKIINIDTASSIWSSSTNMDFYIDILEPLKNALYISIIKSNILLNPKNSLNGVAIADGDNVYVNMNDYNRISTTISNGNTNNIVTYFEQISLNLTEKYQLYYIQGGAIPLVYSFTNNYITTANLTDSHMFILNPAEPNLKRFNIKLYDKNNNILQRSEITRFNMTICIYYNRRKTTMG